MTDEILMRPARHEDYEAIMEIGDVYEGVDYLPSMYHSFLDDTNIHAVVAEVDGKPVITKNKQYIENQQFYNIMTF